MDWRKRKDEGPTKNQKTCINGVLFFFFFSFSMGWLGGDRRIQDVEADRPFPYLTRKREESYIFSFSVS
jgi:hypothetical protein